MSNFRIGVFKYLLILALVLPWINPFAFGPSPPVVQTLFTWACVALGLLTYAASPQRLDDAALKAWVIAAGISAVYGLSQYFGASERFEPWVNVTAAGEAYGNLRQRNQFATLLNLGLAALLFWAQRTDAGGTPSPQTKEGAASWPWGRMALALLTAVLLSTADAASSSRTGALQLAVLALAAWWWGLWRLPTARRVLLASLLAYGIASAVLPLLAGSEFGSSGILSRLKDGGPACVSRLVLWRNVLHLIALRPWTGWGWGELDFAHFVNLYPGARFCDILDNAHNLPLQLAVELGTPLALAVCGLGGWLVWRAKPWRETEPGRRLAWAALGVILVHSMLEYPLWYAPFQVAAGISLWVLWRKPASAAAPETGSAPQGVAAWANGACLGAAAVLLACVSYAGWDYYRISQIYVPPEERSPRYQDDTLEKIKASWLFRDQVAFAELTTTPLTRDNAERIHALALQMLHFSPEPRVVQRVIESALLLGRRDEAAFFLLRFRAAFAREAAQWEEAANREAAASREAPASR